MLWIFSALYIYICDGTEYKQFNIISYYTTMSQFCYFFLISHVNKRKLTSFYCTNLQLLHERAIQTLMSTTETSLHRTEPIINKFFLTLTNPHSFILSFFQFSLFYKNFNSKKTNTSSYFRSTVQIHNY